MNHMKTQFFHFFLFCCLFLSTIGHIRITLKNPDLIFSLFFGFINSNISEFQIRFMFVCCLSYIFFCYVFLPLSFSTPLWFNPVFSQYFAILMVDDDDHDGFFPFSFSHFFSLVYLIVYGPHIFSIY